MILPRLVYIGPAICILCISPCVSFSPRRPEPRSQYPDIDQLQIVDCGFALPRRSLSPRTMSSSPCAANSRGGCNLAAQRDIITAMAASDKPCPSVPSSFISMW